MEVLLTVSEGFSVERRWLKIGWAELATFCWKFWWMDSRSKPSFKFKTRSMTFVNRAGFSPFSVAVSDSGFSGGLLSGPIPPSRKICIFFLFFFHLCLRKVRILSVIPLCEWKNYVVVTNFSKWHRLVSCSENPVSFLKKNCKSWETTSQRETKCQVMVHKTN